MSQKQVEIEGTLQPDGTLLLDQKPNLPAGRVRVVVQALPTVTPTEDWWQYLQRTRRELEAINYPTMTATEVESYVEWLRGDDDRIEVVYREIEEERRRREQQGC